MARLKNFPNNQGRKLSFKVLQRNAVFANAETVLLTMLANDDEEIFDKEVFANISCKGNKIKKDISGESEKTPSTTSSRFDCFICRFLIPLVNFEATCYYKVQGRSQKKIEMGPNFATFNATSFTYNGILPFVNYARRYYKNCCTKLRKCECDFTDLM